jgi:Spy/CpxP family protein refolding chaperone
MLKTILVTSLALTVLLAGFATQLASAQPGWGEHRGGPMGAFAGPRAEFMFEALDLTPEQRDAVEAIQLVLLTAEMRRELHAVLTPQQRQKALELRNTMREQREQRFQERRERGRAGRRQADDA